MAKFERPKKVAGTTIKQGLYINTVSFRTGYPQDAETKTSMRLTKNTGGKGSVGGGKRKTNVISPGGPIPTRKKGGRRQRGKCGNKFWGGGEIGDLGDTNPGIKGNGGSLLEGIGNMKNMEEAKPAKPEEGAPFFFPNKNTRHRRESATTKHGREGRGGGGEKWERGREKRGGEKRLRQTNGAWTKEWWVLGGKNSRVGSGREKSTDRKRGVHSIHGGETGTCMFGGGGQGGREK